MSNAGKLDPLTNEFVQATLGHASPNIIPLAGDASSRRYFRIVVEDQSYVLMAWEPFSDDTNYPFLNIHAHFAKNGVQVPKVIAKAPKLGVVLLEDLGDLTLERKFWENQEQNLCLPHYKQAIDELLKIHIKATEDTNTSCIAFRIAFNTEKLLWEMNYGRDHFFVKFCKIKLSEAALKELDRVFLEICTYLDQVEKVICHRDFHSRNIMIKHGACKIIDFQDARMGPIQYDLVSLIHDSYVDLNLDMQDKILNHYITQTKERTGKIISRDEFFEVFRVQMIQRCFKACGSFASFFNMREDTRYLKYLAPTLEKVALTLDQYPIYRPMLKIIQDNGLLQKDFTLPTTGAAT